MYHIFPRWEESRNGSGFQPAISRELGVSEMDTTDKVCLNVKQLEWGPHSASYLEVADIRICFVAVRAEITASVRHSEELNSLERCEKTFYKSSQLFRIELLRIV